MLRKFLVTTGVATTFVLGVGLSAHAAQIIRLSNGDLREDGAFVLGTITVDCEFGNSNESSLVSYNLQLTQKTTAGQLASGSTTASFKCTGDETELPYQIDTQTVAFKPGVAQLSGTVTECDDFGTCIDVAVTEKVILRM
jgi:hypothetical protein